MGTELIAEMTGVAVETIELNRPVQVYGVDSLMSQEIVGWAQKALNVTVTQADVFAGITIEKLVSLAL